MKKTLLRVIAMVFISGIFASCTDEEIMPSDQLNNDNTIEANGVTKDDKGF